MWAWGFLDYHQLVQQRIYTHIWALTIQSTNFTEQEHLLVDSAHGSLRVEWLCTSSSHHTVESFVAGCTIAP